MDHESTDEPWFVWDRAVNLDKLSKNDVEPSEYSFGLGLPEEFIPKNEPSVKWVNWRWPRYEWNPDRAGIEIVSQWLVHDNILLQQLVLKNNNDSSVDDFWFELRKNVLIRDLDYLDLSYPFNESDEGYIQHQTPDGYGSVTVHLFHHEGPNDKNEGSVNGDASKRSEPVDLGGKSPGLGTQAATIRQLEGIVNKPTGEYNYHNEILSCIVQWLSLR